MILSSEWHYSPFTYVPLQDLPNFVWVGLPASESSNALLTPLAGHEFGHSVWAVRKLRRALSTPITSSIINFLVDDANREAFVKAHPEAEGLEEPTDLFSDVFVVHHISEAYGWAIRQFEEVFCDCVGLRVFGESYLHAFAYVLAPGSVHRGSRFYPSMEDRVSHLLTAAERFAISVPEGFREAFVSTDAEQTPDILLSAAEHAVAESLEAVIARVKDLVASSDISDPSDEDVSSCLEAFRLLMPAGSAKSLAAIINAGWRAANDDMMWQRYTAIDDRKRVLNELLLKSAQVLEFNLLVSEGDDSAGSSVN